MRQAVATVLALVAGFGVGWFGGAPAESAQPFVAAEVRSNSDSAPCDWFHHSVTNEVESLEFAVAQERRLISTLMDIIEQHGLAAQGGTPMTWPDGLPPSMGPDGFRAAIDEALATCPTAFPDYRTDCEEFPCVLFWVDDDFDSRRLRDSPDCPALQSKFGNAGRPSGWPLGDEGTAGVRTMQFWPENLDEFSASRRGNIAARHLSRIAEQVFESVLSRYAQPCESGDAMACVYLAEAAARKRDRASRIDYLRQACDLGSSPSCDFIAALDPVERHWE